MFFRFFLSFLVRIKRQLSGIHIGTGIQIGTGSTGVRSDFIFKATDTEGSSSLIVLFFFVLIYFCFKQQPDDVQSKTGYWFLISRGVIRMEGGGGVGWLAGWLAGGYSNFTGG